MLSGVALCSAPKCAPLLYYSHQSHHVKLVAPRELGSTIQMKGHRFLKNTAQWVNVYSTSWRQWVRVQSGRNEENHSHGQKRWRSTSNKTDIAHLCPYFLLFSFSTELKKVRICANYGGKEKQAPYRLFSDSSKQKLNSSNWSVLKLGILAQCSPEWEHLTLIVHLFSPIILKHSYNHFHLI